MHRTVTLVATVCMAVAGSAAAPRASAQSTRTVVCESTDGRMRQCRIPARSQVRLVEERSRALCRMNSTWGVRDDYIWVDRGCRGRFTIAVVAGGSVGGGYGGGVYREGHSDDDRYGVYGGGYGGGHDVWHGRDHDRNSVFARVEEACVREAHDAHTWVDGFSDWSHVHGNLWAVDMWVRGRSGRRRVRCAYDRHRDAAWLDWRR